MARRSKLDKQLDDLAARFTPQIKAAFLESVRGIKSTAILNAITAAIDVGDLEAAFRATGLSPAAMRPISAMIERAFETGGVTVADNVPRGLGGAVFRFDVRNSRAEAWLRDHSSTLVTRITEDTKDNIRTLIQAGVRDGRNPRNIALDIIGRVNPDTKRREGGIIGLTAPQERWVANARTDLFDLSERYFTREARDKRFDSVVRRAIDTDTALPVQKINAIVDRYSDNLLLQRGETLARTEAIQSLNKSADEAFRQAIDEGLLKSNAVTKTWDSSGDNRVRETHREMDGQTVQMDEPFTTLNGAKLMFPGDSSLGAPADEIIACRCKQRFSVDWFADLDDDPLPTPAPPAPVLDVPAPPINTPVQPMISNAKTFEDFEREVTPDIREWRRNWTSSQKEEIDAYINSSQINRDLRGGNPGPSTISTANVLDAVVRSAPVFEQDTYVYRSVDIRNFPAKVGDTYVDAGFVSTSLAEFSQDIWEKFYGEQARMRILVRKGTPKAIIERDINDPDNNMTEVLLGRGATFTIIENGRDYLEVEMK